MAEEAHDNVMDLEEEEEYSIEARCLDCFAVVEEPIADSGSIVKGESMVAEAEDSPAVVLEAYAISPILILSSALEGNATPKETHLL